MPSFETIHGRTTTRIRIIERSPSPEPVSDTESENEKVPGPAPRASMHPPLSGGRCFPQPLPPKAREEFKTNVNLCICGPHNTTFRLMPWDPVPTFNQDAVDAVGAMFRYHTPERMGQMAPVLINQCSEYKVTPKEVFEVLTAFHNIRREGNKSKEFSEDLRYRVLCVAMAMHNVLATQTAFEAINKGRKMEWTRLTKFVGDFALVTLAGGSLTSTLGCATYLAGAAAASHVASAKGAAAVSSKLKLGTMAAATGVGATFLGVSTVVAGAFTVGAYVESINAFRDTWDNSFARDAFMFHKLRHHNSTAPGEFYYCNHSNGDWTGMSSHLVTGHRGIQRN